MHTREIVVKLVSRFLRALIASAFGIILAIVILEVAVRALHLAPPAEPVGNFWQSPHPQFGWYHVPGASGLSYDAFGEYNVRVTINSKGLRDEEIPYEKPQSAGTTSAAGCDESMYRILLLGDSFVEGMRTELRQTAGKVLEARLNEGAGSSANCPARRFQVITAGVGAWGADQELLWFRHEGVKYHPDLVLLMFFTANDFLNDSEALETANVGGVYKPFFALQNGQLALKYFPFDPKTAPAVPTQAEGDKQEPAPEASPQPPLAFLGSWLHQHSALQRYLTPRLQEAAPGLALTLARWGLMEVGRAAKKVALGPNYIPLAYEFYARPRDPAWDEAVAITAALLAQLNHEVEAVGARFAVVIANAQEQVNPAAWQSILRRYPAMQARAEAGQVWDLTQPNRDLAAMLGQTTIPFLDLLPIFQAQPARPPLYLPRDGHWTVAGERVAGEAMAAFLRDQKLIPP